MRPLAFLREYFEVTVNVRPDVGLKSNSGQFIFNQPVFLSSEWSFLPNQKFTLMMSSRHGTFGFDAH